LPSAASDISQNPLESTSDASLENLTGADLFRDASQAKGIQPCIPGRKSRKGPVRYDKCSYRRRSRIEIMFGRLKNWRRGATRNDRCATVFLPAVALAATVIFWL
jgi:transposase